MQQPYTFDTGATTGGAGVSTATSPTKQVAGRVVAIGVTYTDSPPATTDVTVRTKGKHGPVQTVLSLANANTDGWFYPQIETQTYDGNPAFWSPYAIDDELEVVVAQANDGDSVQVVVLVEP